MQRAIRALRRPAVRDDPAGRAVPEAAGKILRLHRGGKKARDQGGGQGADDDGEHRRDATISASWGQRERGRPAAGPVAARLAPRRGEGDVGIHHSRVGRRDRRVIESIASP